MSKKSHEIDIPELIDGDNEHNAKQYRVRKLNKL